jgi:hypothetical protein
MIHSSINYKGIRVSAHAQDRAAQRTSIKDAAQLCEKAYLSLTEGIDALGDPALRELCLARAKKNQNCGMYAFEGIVYIFKEATLTTVYPIGWLGAFHKMDEFDNRDAA